MLLVLLIVVQGLLLVPKMSMTNYDSWRIAKGFLVVYHQKWIDSIQKQCEQLKIGLKAYQLFE
jgi:hypothetical protein